MREKIVRYSLISVGVLSVVILLFIFMKYLLPIFSPFIIALLIAAVTVSPARKLSTRIKAPERIVRLVISITATLFFFSAIALTVWRISTALWGFLSDLADDNRLYDILSAILSADVPILGKILPPELAEKISVAIDQLISGGLSALAGWLTSFAASLPRIFLFVLVTLISLVYFALDYDRIVGLISSLLPEKALSVIIRIRSNALSVMKKYIFSYSLIMLITYSVLLVGLWLLRVGHAATLAFFIALLDILPVIGVGTVLIPWSIFSFLGGNTGLGIGLIVLFIANALIRQFSEPKIVGKSLDLHPIITLMMIYVGYALFGVFGMLILPVAAVTVFSVLKGDNTAHIA